MYIPAASASRERVRVCSSRHVLSRSAPGTSATAVTAFKNTHERSDFHALK